MHRLGLPRLVGVLCISLSVTPGLAAEVAQTYMRDCAVCHLPGIAGAPKAGDKKEWSRRIRAGFDMLYRNALEGIPNTAMQAKGGQTDLSDELVKAIVDYMVNAATLEPQVMAAARRYDKLGIGDRDFVRFDANYDGFLSPQELTEDPVLVSHLRRFDEDGDGRLSPAEFRRAESTLDAERIAAYADDASLVSAVRTGLGKVPGVDLASTKIEADRGVVSIVGIVSSADIVRRAHAVVKRIPGIKKIDNRLVSGEQIGWD
jgi:cytochrome c5